MHRHKLDTESQQGGPNAFPTNIQRTDTGPCSPWPRNPLGRFTSVAGEACVLAVGKKLGEGGYSTVYTATDLNSGRRLSVKIPKADGASGVGRIKHEYRAVRRINHSGIVGMQQLLRVGDQYAIVMDRLRNPSLCEAIRGSTPKGVLPDLAGLTAVLADLVATLSHVHACGWIHGDIKPENVLFADSGAARWIDLGLATYRLRPHWIPAANELVGTFAYLPPESIIGEPVDPSADMFSFGRLLAMLLCGRLPSWDPSLGTRAADIRIRQQLPKDTPKHLADLCVRLVRIVPEQRPTAAEVYQILIGRDAPPLPAPASQCSGNSPAPWLDTVRAGTAHAYRRAASGQGSVLLLRCDPGSRLDVERTINGTPSSEPRLVVTGHCDATEETPLPAFDDILDQLAIWIRQLPPAVWQRWQPTCGNSLAAVAPELATAFGFPPSDHAQGAPTVAELEEASVTIAALLERISQQRTVVLLLHNIDQIDPRSLTLLRRLVPLTNRSPLVIATTTENDLRPGHVSESMQWILTQADRRIMA